MNKKVGIAVVVLAAVVTGIGLSAYFYFASRKAHVTVTCLELDQLHSNLGVLNVPGYTLGKVLVLDNTSKQALGLMTLATTDQDIAKAGPPQDTLVKLDTKLDLQFDTDVPEAIKAKVIASVNNAMSVALKGLVRTELANPYAFASANSDLKEHVKALGGSRAVVLVSTIKRADALEIRLTDEAQVKSEGNVLTVGDYEITATYKCDGLYKVLGKRSGVFYGVASLAYDRSTDRIVPGESIEVWKFGQSQTFQ